MSWCGEKPLYVFVYLYRAILEHNPGAVVLSTDDYFTRSGEYQFDLSALGEAHEWNQKRGKYRERHTQVLTRSAVAAN